MANTDSGQQAMSTLQDQWYNAVIAGLGLSPGSFQLVQPMVPLGASSVQLWSYFNCLPPLSLTNNNVTGGGNLFYSNYAGVISQLMPPNNSELQFALGDSYGAYTTFVNSLNPPAYTMAPADLTKAIIFWANTNNIPNGAQIANLTISAQNNAITQAQSSVSNPQFLYPTGTPPPAGYPVFSQTIAQLQAALQRAPSAAIHFDSDTESSTLTNTWAEGSVGGMYDLFWGNASGGASQINQMAASSHIVVDASFKSALTFAANPGGWYNSSALGTAYSVQDNTIWQHGTPSWQSTFGPSGNMQRFTTSVVVVDGISITMTSDAAYSSSDQKQIQAQAKTGFWPFFSIEASGGYSSSVSFNSSGQMSSTITSPAGNPAVFGVNVTPVAAYLGS